MHTREGSQGCSANSTLSWPSAPSLQQSTAPKWGDFLDGSHTTAPQRRGPSYGCSVDRQQQPVAWCQVSGNSTSLRLKLHQLSLHTFFDSLMFQTSWFRQLTTFMQTRFVVCCTSGNDCSATPVGNTTGTPAAGGQWVCPETTSSQQPHQCNQQMETTARARCTTRLPAATQFE